MEQIVGELQSEWGVPQSPQEYRITLKVAEERSRGGETAVLEERTDPEDPEELVTGPPPSEEAVTTVRREKAPAAPRVGMVEGSSEDEEAKPRKKRRRRRRGRGKSR